MFQPKSTFPIIHTTSGTKLSSENFAIRKQSLISQISMVKEGRISSSITFLATVFRITQRRETERNGKREREREEREAKV